MAEFKVNDRTLISWVSMLKERMAHNARKSLAYFDGQQEDEIIKILDHSSPDWRKKGMRPRFRNITNMIVTKSSMVCQDGMPTLEVRNTGEDEVDDRATEILYDLLDRTDWKEQFMNEDQIVRLLKTVFVLVQYDTECDCFNFQILHRGNCAVTSNSMNRTIDGLIHQSDVDSEGTRYRLWTNDVIYDLLETRSDVVVTGQEENTYGFIPVVPFYDTVSPRQGLWVEATNDLVGVNEIVNLHMTEAEYAMSWQKFSTLFMINCGLAGEESSNEMMVPVQTPGYPLPHMQAMPGNVYAGPNRAIYLQTNGEGGGSVEYKNPTVDIKPLDEVVMGWIRGIASDWSVNVKQGEGTATSGFQLIVEEIDNLELRKKRQRSMENGFKRLFKVIRAITNQLTGETVFADEAELFIVFPHPTLPVDTQEQESVWSLKIKEGRATDIDYFMATQGMSKREAEAKVAEIKAYNEVEEPVDAPSVTPNVVIENEGEEVQIASEIEDLAE